MKKLAIKKEIELKELEKFGFEKLEYANINCYRKIITTKSGNGVASYHITDDDSRIIKYDTLSIYSDIDTTLIDLYNANLIESKEV